MISTFAERLKEAMAGPPKVTGRALAEACGIKAPSVSDWLSGKTKTIEGRNLLAAAKRLGVEAEWLATGRGPKRRTAAMTAGEPTASYSSARAKKIDEAVALLDKLDEKQIVETINFIRWQLANKAPPTDGQALSVAA